jgi:hypothetical protein
MRPYRDAGWTTVNAADDCFHSHPLLRKGWGTRQPQDLLCWKGRASPLCCAEGRSPASYSEKSEFRKS